MPPEGGAVGAGQGQRFAVSRARWRCGALQQWGPGYVLVLPVMALIAVMGTPKPAGTGIGRIGIIRDPDGVKIELLDRPDLRAL